MYPQPCWWLRQQKGPPLSRNHLVPLLRPPPVMPPTTPKRLGVKYPFRCAEGNPTPPPPQRTVVVSHPPLRARYSRPAGPGPSRSQTFSNVGSSLPVESWDPRPADARSYVWGALEFPRAASTATIAVPGHYHVWAPSTKVTNICRMTGKGGPGPWCHGSPGLFPPCLPRVFPPPVSCLALPPNLPPPTGYPSLESTESGGSSPGSKFHPFFGAFVGSWDPAAQFRGPGAWTGPRYPANV